MGISSSDLASIRTVMEGFMPDSFINGRTGTTAVRLTAEKRLERLPGLPSTLGVPRWQLKLPDGTDVIAGDEGSVPGKGTFRILYVDDPASYTVEIVCHAVRMRDAAGVVPFPTNTTVTFRNPRGVGSSATPFTADVFLSETSLDVEIFPEAAGYKYSVLFDPALGVRGGWEMSWTDILGEDHTEIMSEPTRLTDVLPIVLSHVKTQ